MSRKLHVLVVDDEEILRDSMAETLRAAGYEVVTAEDGLVARQRMAERSYQVVVTDLSMGEHGGLDLLEHIRNTEPGIPVLLVTAYGTVENAVAAMKGGAFDYITKPFSADELEIVASRALEVVTTVRGITAPEETVRALPAIELQGQDGARYSRTARVENGALVLVRKLIVPETNVTPEAYAAFADFCRAVSAAEVPEVPVLPANTRRAAAETPALAAR